MSFMSYMFLFVPLLYQCFQDLSRNFIESIRSIEESIPTDSGDTHLTIQHPCPLNSDTTDECVYLNYDHGVQ